MKKILYLTAAAAVSLFAASCSNDDVPEQTAGGMTTFRVQLPEQLASRAFGDGQSAQNLYVAIYDATAAADAQPLFSNFPGGDANGMSVTKFDNLTATVTVDLVKNKTYNIVLWAQQPTMAATGGAFTFSPTNRNITVDYTKLSCNDENADAFYSYETYISSPTANKTFKLYRPFAQINIGTDDLATAATAGLSVPEAGMTATGVANVLDLTTGSATGDVTVNYVAKALPTTTDGAFPVTATGKTYSYLTMGYVLVPAAKTAKGTTNVSLVIPNGPQSPFATYDNVPVQANYRTNIYGSLLTNPEVFNVEIVPDFAGTYDKEIVAVSTTSEFTTALANAKDGDVIRPTSSIDLASSGTLNVNNDITIDVPEGVTVTTARQGDNANILVAAGKTLHLTGKGTLSGDNRIVDTSGNLVVDGPTFNTSTPYKGAAISVNKGGNLTFNSGTVNAGLISLWVEGDATINGGTISSTSTNQNKNPEGQSVWSYSVKAVGPQAHIVINDGVFTGVQGIVTTDQGGTVDINGGVFSTHNTNPGDMDGFYCVYATENGTVNITGGYFSGANSWLPTIAEGTSCVVSGDNDVQHPYGTLNISGGYFSGKPYCTPSPQAVVNPAVGYEYQPCDVTKDGLTFKWTVAKSK